MQANSVSVTSEGLKTAVSRVPRFNVNISFSEPILKYNKYIQMRDIDRASVGNIH